MGKEASRFGAEEEDEGPPFELEAALERVVGIEAVKASLLSLRNRLEVTFVDKGKGVEAGGDESKGAQRPTWGTKAHAAPCFSWPHSPTLRHLILNLE